MRYRCPQRTAEDEACSGTLEVTRQECWIEVSCTECDYECSRHQDSTGPVQETGEDQERETRKWWD